MSEPFREEEARRYAINTDYWKDRALKAEARVAELEFWVRRLQGFMDECPVTVPLTYS